MTSRLRVHLGTFVAIDAHATDAARREHAVALGFAAIARIEALLHPTRPGSDLAALRRQPPGEPLCVHPWTWELLELSQRLHRCSQGAFDPCLPEAEGRLSDVELATGCRIVLRRPVHVDLGGIAKGFAVDQALAALRAGGCHAGLVNAGGDLAVFGALQHTVECRTGDGTRLPVTLRDAALATSDAAPTDAGRPAEHRGYYHGATRRPVDQGHATVTAATAAVADALTKCVLVGGGTQRPLLHAFGARLIHC